MRKKTSKTNTAPSILAALTLACITIMLCGCSTYNTGVTPSRPSEPLDYGIPTADLIFHRPVVHYLNDRYTPLKPYVKPDWPVARAPQGYVTDYDTMTYAEHYYSDQYIHGNAQPRIHFHRRVQGTRYRQMTR